MVVSFDRFLFLFPQHKNHFQSVWDFFCTPKSNKSFLSFFSNEIWYLEGQQRDFIECIFEFNGLTRIIENYDRGVDKKSL